MKLRTASPLLTVPSLLGVLSMFAVLSIAGCNQESNTPDQPVESAMPTPSETSKALSGNWAPTLLEQADTAHQELRIAGKTLRQAVEDFLEQPGVARLKTAREAWRAAHQAYKAVRLYHHLSIQHPEFDRTSPNPVKHKLSRRIDSYPLEPGYLDYVEGYPFSGLVFSESVPISAESLNVQHQYGDSSYVTLGFHAMEFLLWGENSNPETRRPWQDYQKAREGAAPSEHEAARLRRRQMLQVISATLANDLEALGAAWDQPNGWFTTAFNQQVETQKRLLVRNAIEKTLQDEIVAPFQRILQLEGKEWNQTAVESAFSHNGKDDLLAAIRPLQWILSNDQSSPQSTAIFWDLTPRQLEELTGLQVKLQQTAAKFDDGAFAPTSHPLRPDDVAAVREANAITWAMLALLQTP